MKRIAIFLMCLMSSTIWAGGIGGSDFRPFVLVGLTSGGDKTDIEFTDGNKQRLDYGGLYQLGVGMLYQPKGKPFEAQISWNFHGESLSSSGGKVSWTRYPVEVLGFYRPNAQWRFGGGLRFVRSIEQTAEFTNLPTITVEAENITSFVLEAGYSFNEYVTISARAVLDEKFEPTSVNGKKAASSKTSNGRHVGIFAQVNFF